MKRIILWFVCLAVTISLEAQKQKPKQSLPGKKTIQRCATDEYLQRLLAADPGLKARMEEAEARISQKMNDILLRRNGQENQRINAVVTIPVVVHVILPNPNIVTDADVLWQINKMNTDFAGLNADSTNAGSFLPLRGHSQIQFCLARRDPSGNPTNGVTRTASALNFDQNNFNDLKYTANCGAGAWDPSQYFNIWVAESVDGTLGVATFPGGGVPLEQGIVLAHEGFGNNPTYTSPSFNLGRTAVHETGHYFYARHIWGDGGGCQSDFPNVGGLAGSWIDDTPPQSGPTIGCPTGIVEAGCGSPTPPGRMYQNYMDYTNDACYSMFTKNQVLRMEAALEIFRNSLTTSTTCTQPTIFTNDASIAAILTPTQGNGCIAANNTFCAPSLVAQVTLKNYGSTNLTSATINVQVDGNTPVPYAWTGNLAPNASTTVTLPAVAATPGTHNVTISVTNPNGGVDGRLTNNSLSTTFIILTPTTAPIVEGFESATFPPNGWFVINTHGGSLTWERTTDAARSGVASARMRFFDYDDGEDHTDYLLTRPIAVQANDTMVLTFERAYRPYNSDIQFGDSLAVVISFDCGKTFTEIWRRGGVSLATVAGFTDDPFIPTANQWASTRLNIQPYITSSGTIIIGFKAVNKFGNNLYIDNVNIDTTANTITDVLLTNVVLPFRHECRRALNPVVTLRNNGNDTLTKATIVMMLDGVIVDSTAWVGFLRPGNQQNVELKNLNIPGGANHVFTAFTRRPNDLIDVDPFNDTVRRAFIVHDQQAMPVVEGFENTTFPPTNWSIDSSYEGYSWERTTRAAATGVASAWIRNYRFNSNGKRDDLYSPLLQATEFDSLKISFDLAHAMVSPATAVPDTLEVLITKDCGYTFESIYKKWGTQLQTSGLPPPVFPQGDTVGFVPTPTQWRKENLDITTLVNTTNKFMVVFRATSNRGNNLFLDNINIKSVLLPEKLKANGYLITPSPFASSFTIRHVQPPTTLQAVVVTNTAGQTVYIKKFTGNASNFIEVNLGQYAAGMYHVKLIYSNKVVDQKLVKM